jgi:hypothetical protein
VPGTPAGYLDHEYQPLNERLGETRGANSAFFVFANTVAAHSFSQKHPGHGWPGIRFQRGPGDAPSQFDLHVRLQGKENIHRAVGGGHDRLFRPGIRAGR